MNIFISGKVTGDNLANVKFLNASLTLENLFGRKDRRKKGQKNERYNQQTGGD